MKFRVIDLKDGKEVNMRAFTALMISASGDLFVCDMHNSLHCFEDYFLDLTEIAVEVAFVKDEENQWVWEHSVMHE